jgi:glycosyltransferase involved in cell wall biosynthesis
LDEKDLESYRRTADFLNLTNVDMLCVQHEFGIYGGPAGSHLLALLNDVKMPVVTTLHTVLSEPNSGQRLVMDALSERSDRIIVMAQKGVDILEETYKIPLSKIDLIPHGIPDSPFCDSSDYKKAFGVEGRHVLLTFGLLSPGKGIEYVIEALPDIVKRHPNVVYLILGATHPQLVAREGEAYRLSLERLAEDRGVKDHVIFYNRFVSLDDLQEFIGATDIYITPYLNEAQITSGTLASVFGAGKAVVSTPYWHAKELLSDGRGLLVPFRDSGAIATAVCTYLDNPKLLNTTRQGAYALGRDTIWPVTAARYMDSFRHAFADRRALPRAAFGEWTLASRPYELPPLRMDHIVNMTDNTGIFQHAIYTVPNYHEGYCTDDNARAYILAVLRNDSLHAHPEIARLSTIYLGFLAAAFNHGNGRFRNFMSHSRQWLETKGSEDSHGRALWALGVGVRHSQNNGHQKLSTLFFKKGLATAAVSTSPRAWAFTILGLNDYLHLWPNDTEAKDLVIELTERLIRLWKNFATDDWPWFEPSATYENARLCQALIVGGQWLPQSESLAIGLKSLEWLAKVQTAQGGHFSPIACHGFYERNSTKANFDQQPVEAQGMVSACLEAFRATQNPKWTQEAKRAFEWFLGRNELGLSLYDPSTGGCNDGLQINRLNENQGAESSLAFHLSLVEMNTIRI